MYQRIIESKKRPLSAFLAEITNVLIRSRSKALNKILKIMLARTHKLDLPVISMGQRV